jgi:hypothetical protein
MKPKLDRSPDFTLEDIRKIRDYFYETSKDMTLEEQFARSRAAGDRVEKEIQRIREEKQKNKNINL